MGFKDVVYTPDKVAQTIWFPAWRFVPYWEGYYRFKGVGIRGSGFRYWDGERWLVRKRGEPCEMANDACAFYGHFFAGMKREVIASEEDTSNWIPE